MHSAISLSVAASFPAAARSDASPLAGIRFCGLRREALGLHRLRSPATCRIQPATAPGLPRTVAAAAVSGNGSPASGFDYDLVIIGAGVGGHGAALHAVEKGLKTAIIEGDVVGGTCVNRGCVPSKALLAVSGRMRELHDEHHLKSLGLKVSSPGYDRQGVADHANNLASKIRSNLTNSMKAHGIDILTGLGTVVVGASLETSRQGLEEVEVARAWEDPESEWRRNRRS